MTSSPRHPDADQSPKPRYSHAGGNPLAPEQLITEHLDLWTSAIKQKSRAGGGSSSKTELYGIKKLRELILELAVRGLLVPQDPSDEPASDLINRINDAKSLLVKNGKIKKQKDLAPLRSDDIPFSIPSEWSWIRLGEVGHTQTGGTPKKSDSHHYGSHIPFLKPGDILDGKIHSYSNDGLSEEGANSLGRIADNDSVLMVCIGTIGKCARVDRPVSFNQQINSISPYLEIGEYIVKALQASFFQNKAWDESSSTTIAILNKGKWEQIAIPLPPQEEQHRIVAKVDELMALCDQLEQQTEASLSAHQTLVETLLGALTNAASHDSFQQAWQRIAQHFDTLFTTEQSIDQLKQTILQLAVMGKLVPQDPNDEPASELLRIIATEKAKLVNEGKVKKQKALPPISDEERPFDAPIGWEWCRVWDIAHTITSGSRDWAKYYSDDGAIFVTMGNLSRGDYRLRLDNIRYVNPPDEGEGKRTKLEENDLLISITGDVGNLGLIPKNFGEAYINQHTALLRFMGECKDRFFPELMRSPLAKEQFDAPQRGIKNSFRLGDVGEIIIPLPPTNERRRIVAKIDELMKLCDQLKFRINEADTAQLSFTDSIDSLFNINGFENHAIQNKNEKHMKISTKLILTNIAADESAVIAPLLAQENGEADAKYIWSRTKLELPEFYKQLKREIESGYIQNPKQAEIER